MRYQRSSALFRAAHNVLPGGVNSPVRAFKAVGGTPVFVREARGAYFTDEDGNRFIDFIASWGPLLFGHAFQPVLDAVIQRTRKGTSFGMPTALETELAELVVSMVPNIDKVRFVNSGTEACMSAIRLARGYTCRDKIIKFAGCYHGHADAFLIQAGSGAVTFGSPNSPGVTAGTAKDTLLARYNHLESVEKLIKANPEEIAAVILEPVAGNMGCIPPEPGFLEGDGLLKKAAFVFILPIDTCSGRSKDNTGILDHHVNIAVVNRLEVGIIKDIATVFLSDNENLRTVHFKLVDQCPIIVVLEGRRYRNNREALGHKILIHKAAIHLGFSQTVNNMLDLP